MSGFKLEVIAIYLIDKMIRPMIHASDFSTYMYYPGWMHTHNCLRIRTQETLDNVVP